MKNHLKYILTIFLVCSFTCSYASNASGINSWQEKNGLKVMYMHSHDIPMVDVRLLLNAGSNKDEATPGVASLTAAMLDQGTSKQDANQIADAFTEVGAIYTSEVSRDYAMFGFRSLSEKQKFTNTLTQFTNLFSQHKFLPNALERQKKILLTTIQDSLQRPDEVAKNALYKSLYKDHPYASPVEGSTETVENLLLNDLNAFYQKHYHAKKSVLAIVGDISTQDAKSIANKIASALPKQDKAGVLQQQTSVYNKADSELKIKFPSEQTHIYLATIGIERGHPDYFPLYVGNHIFGGNSVSILYNAIREQQGLAYHVFSSFIPLKEKGPFVIGVQTRNNAAEKTLNSIRQELKTYLTNGASNTQLENAKQHITGNFALRQNSNKKLVNYLAMIGFYNLPLNYLEEFNANIKKVTLTDINIAMNKIINKNNLLTIQVGG